jgi:copper resistance protein C
MKTKLFQRLALSCALLLVVQITARAHAFLDRADPKVGGEIAKSPDKLKLWFTQDVEPAFSSVEVRDAGGKEVDKKDARVDDKDHSLLVVSLPDLPSGTYRVTWHVASVDTHKTQGHFEFTIK